MSPENPVTSNQSVSVEPRLAPVPVENPGPQALRSAFGNQYGPNVQNGPVQAETGTEAVEPISGEQATEWGKVTLNGAGVTESVPVTGAAASSDVQVAKGGNYTYTPTYIAPPTDAQIARGKQFGFDLNQQQKYHSQTEWANRNNQ